MSTSPDSGGDSSGTGYQQTQGSSVADSTPSPDFVFNSNDLGIDFGTNDIDLEGELFDMPANTMLMPANSMLPSLQQQQRQPGSNANTQPVPPGLTGPDASAERSSRFWTKKAHKKSRGGCVICKQRKVKCDEAKPSCTNCKLRAETCVYKQKETKAPARAAKRPGDSMLSASAMASSAATPTANASTTLAVRGQSPNATFFSSILPEGQDMVFDDNIGLETDQSEWATPGAENPKFDVATPLIIKEPIFNPLPMTNDDQTHLKLLWRFTSETSQSFSFDTLATGFVSPTTEIMRSAVVQHAFNNPFLMDSIFALAALHELNMKPFSTPAEWTRALQLKQKSFMGYHKAIIDADPATFPALLANSLLLCALASQNFRDPDAPDLYIIEWMVVWKGIGIIIELISVQTLIASGIHPIFFRPTINLTNAAQSTPNNLLFMISSIPSTDPDHAEISEYYEVLKHLGALYADLPGGITPIMQLRIITIATFLPKRYVELLRMRRVRALVIVAYCAMFFKLIPETWWSRNIGQRTLLDVQKHFTNHPSLSSSPSASLYVSLLAKPIAAITIDDSKELARHILDDPFWQPNIPSYEEVETQVKSLTWVDNAGRRVVLEPANNRMVVQEYEGAELLEPYFDSGNCDPSMGRPSPETLHSGSSPDDIGMNEDWV